jgi:hypothetical protein
MPAMGTGHAEQERNRGARNLGLHRWLAPAEAINVPMPIVCSSDSQEVAAANPSPQSGGNLILSDSNGLGNFFAEAQPRSSEKPFPVPRPSR